MTVEPRATPARRFLKATHDLVFHHVHGGQLIYNACWEDPRIDRELLALQPDSRVVMITSAGCNALDYLLDGPAEIHAIDVNPRQNAVLELKLALITRGDFGDLFEFLASALTNVSAPSIAPSVPCSPFPPARFGTPKFLSSTRAV